MTKRTSRRRKSQPKKAGRTIGPLWWGIGLLAVGWLVFDAQKTTILDRFPQVAALGWEPPSRAASAPASAPQPVERRAAAPVTPPIREAARTPSTTSPASSGRAPAAAAPRNRAGEDAARAGSAVTRRATPLRREPSAEAPVWLTLEPGRPVRITGSEGRWRRVESGILTGWLDRDALAARPEASTTPRRTASSASSSPGPIPPSAIP